MSAQLTQQFLKDAAVLRPDYYGICAQGSEALASYFEGDALRRLIRAYPKEDDEKFTWRREAMMNSYDNYVKEISESYIEGVFRTKPAKRETPNAQLDTYLKDEYADWFTQELAPFMLFMPEIYVICDIPKADGEIHSEKDRQEKQGHPFPVICFPQYCVNFGYGPDNQIEWISFFYNEPPTEEELKAAQKGDKDIWYEVYTADEYAVFNQKGELVTVPDLETNPVAHGRGQLPVIRITYRPNLSATDSRRCGHAFMHSIVKIGLGGLTAKGVLHDYEYYSLFPKLVAHPDTLTNMVETGIGGNKPIATAASNQDAKLTGDTHWQDQPYYLSVPVEEFQAVERICFERIPQAAYKAARLRDRSGGKTMEQSGIAKMFDMVPELGVLKAVAKYFRRFDVAIVKMLASMADSNEEDVKVEYPTSFDIKTLSEILKDAQELGKAMKESALPSSETASAMIAEQIYLGWFPDLTESEVNEIKKEILAALQAPDVPVTAPPEPIVT